MVDINSAYPFAMTEDHWFGFEGVAGSEWPKKHKAQSFYVVDCFSKGVFPERTKIGISYPVKKGRFFVTGWELITAKKLGLVDKLEILICYSPVQVKSMRLFAQTLYDAKNKAREKGDKEEEFFNKIAVNSGYGKLALNPERFSEVRVTEIYDKPKRWEDKEDKENNPDREDWKNCWDDRDRNLSFWKRSSYREGIDKFVNVATAASITGFVRAYLMEAMSKCDGLAYCDTDSIIAKTIRGMKFGNALGEWKLEMEKAQLWIAGKKLYAAKGRDTNGKIFWKTAHKGVNLSPEKIIEVAKGNPQTMTFDAPTYSLFSKPKFVTREINKR